ncbi:MAG: malate:quinone oxidoreductase, partial [Kocuria sp.]|nr:malate:quinone oxidoreductase [Kocuria sp.]
QVMKKDPQKGGVLQFGTELVTSADGSIGALLGASPGASTAVPIMLNLLSRCFPSKISDWEPRLKELIPAYGVKLNDNPQLADEVIGHTSRVLGIR